MINDRMDVTQAKEALDLFSEYALRIEKQTGGSQDPQLILFSDGSGKVADLAGDRKYMEFESLADLVAQLKGRKEAMDPEELAPELAEELTQNFLQQEQGRQKPLTLEMCERDHQTELNGGRRSWQLIGQERKGSIRVGSILHIRAGSTLGQVGQERADHHGAEGTPDCRHH